MRVAYDTNVLLYYEGVNGVEAQRQVRGMVGRISPLIACLPMQVCAEMFRALVTKFKWDRPRALATVESWQSALATQGLSTDGFSHALSLAVLHQVQIFDAMILASAAEAGCSVLLSQDLQHGFAWRGCTVVDPFAQPIHPALAAVITPR